MKTKYLILQIVHFFIKKIYHIKYPKLKLQIFINKPASREIICKDYSDPWLVAPNS